MSSNDDRITESEIVTDDDSRQALSATEKSIVRSAGIPLPDVSSPSSAVAAQTIAQVQARYIVAERRPRDMRKVEAALMQECASRGFAEVARYAKPIGGGRNIEGLSIRFAEAAIREYGNILVQDFVTHDDDEKRVVKVSVTDLERNVYYDHDVTLRKTVERRFVKEGQRVLSTRVNSTGRTVHLVEATDDELETKQGAHISKAIRTLALRLLPQWLKEKCETTIIATLKAAATAKPDETRTKLIEAFASRSVSSEELESFLGHPLDATTPDEMVDLRAAYLALADGEMTWLELVQARAVDPGAIPPPAEGEEEEVPPPPGETLVSRKARELKQQIRRNRARAASLPKEEVPEIGQ